MDHRLHRLVEVPVPAATIPVVVTANTPDRHRPGGVPALLRHVGQPLVLLWWLDQPQPDEALLERPGHAPHLLSYASSSYVVRRDSPIRRAPGRGTRPRADRGVPPSEEQRFVQSHG